MDKIGSYEVVEILEKGPTTLVVRAKHARLARTVILRAAIDSAPSSAADGIAREAALLEAIDHPNVVRCLDVFEEAGKPVLVVVDVRGAPLSRVLEATPRLSLEGGVEIARSLAHALAAVHLQGAVHADVKPSNLILGEDGTLVLIDFGNATRTGDRFARRDRGGTAAYMAPEQLVGECLAGSDVFALGVCLYETLAGARPLEASAHRGRSDEREVPLRKKRPDTPEWLETLVESCLAKNAADRPTAAAVARLLDGKVREQAGKRAIRDVLVAARLLAATVEPAGNPLLLPEEKKRAVQYWGGVAALVVLAALAFYGLRPVDRTKGLATGSLKIIAIPWAEITIDGTPVDTTPFARSVELAPGTHYVLFEHPSAKPERREIEIAPGKLEVLEVTMGVPAAPSALLGRAP